MSSSTSCLIRCVYSRPTRSRKGHFKSNRPSFWTKSPSSPKAGKRPRDTLVMLVWDSRLLEMYVAFFLYSYSWHFIQIYYRLCYFCAIFVFMIVRFKEIKIFFVVDYAGKRRPSKEPTSTRSVRLQETSRSADASWPALSSKTKWPAPSSFVVTTCITFASTIVSRSDTRTFRFTAVPLSG